MHELSKLTIQVRVLGPAPSSFEVQVWRSITLDTRLLSEGSQVRVLFG